MKFIVSILVVLAIGFSALADEPKEKQLTSKAIAAELETFSGIWEIIDVQPPGSVKDAQRLVFRQDQTYVARNKNNEELWAGTFNLDPTATPSIWDHRSNESKKIGGDVLGIYDLDGDQLKVSCVVGTWKNKQWTGKPRPTEFKLPAADVVLKLRRVITGPGKPAAESP